MAVDLSKIQAKMGRSGAKTTFSPKATVLDSIGLRKSWSRTQTPGYWVEILYDKKLDLYAIKKRWSFWNSQEAKQIEGETIGRRSSSPGGVCDDFVDAINSKLTQEYEIVSRKAQDESPARDHDFGVEAEGSAQAASTTAQPALRRKASYDVW